MTQADPILAVDRLTVRFTTDDGWWRRCAASPWPWARASAWGWSAKSGSGKSQTFMAVMGLMAQNGKMTGSASYRGQELLGLKPSELKRSAARR